MTNHYQNTMNEDSVNTKEAEMLDEHQNEIRKKNYETYLKSSEISLGVVGCTLELWKDGKNVHSLNLDSSSFLESILTHKMIEMVETGDTCVWTSYHLKKKYIPRIIKKYEKLIFINKQYNPYGLNKNMMKLYVDDLYHFVTANCSYFDKVVITTFH